MFSNVLLAFRCGEFAFGVGWVFKIFADVFFCLWWGGGDFQNFRRWGVVLPPPVGRTLDIISVTSDTRG